MKSDSPGVENEMKVVLPNKFVEELLKLLEHSDEKIDFYFGDRSAKVETKQFSLSSVLHEGKYPDWRKVVPEGNNNKVEVKKEDFVHGLARAMAISTDQQEAITLFNEDGDLHLKTKNSITNDEANAKVPLAKKADEFKIAFNAKYLSDAVNKVDSDTVVFEIKDSTTAIKMYGDSAKETTFIIMPMKL